MNFPDRRPPVGGISRSGVLGLTLVLEVKEQPSRHGNGATHNVLLQRLGGPVEALFCSQRPKARRHFDDDSSGRTVISRPEHELDMGVAFQMCRCFAVGGFDASYQRIVDVPLKSHGLAYFEPSCIVAGLQE